MEGGPFIGTGSPSAKSNKANDMAGGGQTIAARRMFRVK